MLKNRPSTSYRSSASVENRQRVLPVVVAVDARRVEPVVDRRLAVGPHEEPFRVRVVHRLLRLAQIEAADDANAAGVRLAEHVAEEIASGRQERARVVKRHARRVLRDDAAHVDKKGVGAEPATAATSAFGSTVESFSLRLVWRNRTGSRIHHRLSMF